MPLKIHEAPITPSGLRYLVFDVEGRVELDDARQLDVWGAPGKPHHGFCVLTRIAKGTEYSAEARKAFAVQGDMWSAVAVVVTSPLVRAALNLMLRYSTSRGDLMRMFTNEDEALAWLESRRLSR